MVNATLRRPPNPSVPRRLGLMGRYGHGVADVDGGGGGHYIVVGSYTLGHGGMGAGVVVANYAETAGRGGVAAFGLDDQGRPTGRTDLVEHAGSGPHPQRQTTAH